MSEVNQKDANENLDKESKEVFEMSSETSEFVNDLLSGDIFDNNSNIEIQTHSLSNISVLNKKDMSSHENKQNTDIQKQDLLRRMLLQEKITESILTKTFPGTLKPKVNVPPPPPPPPKKITLHAKENSIHIDSMSFFNLAVGKNTKDDVLKTMEQKSTVKPESSDKLFNYSDLGVIFSFKNENIKEIIFSESFKGETAEGLKINDPLQKAIELYGLPKMQTSVAALWSNFFVFYNEDMITTIRLKTAS